MKANSLLFCILLSSALLTVPASAQPSDDGWHYGSEGTGDAQRIFATITGDTDSGVPVSLTFSQSDLGGRQLRLEGIPGSADCAAGCRIAISIDGNEAETVRATLPSGAQDILSMRGARDVWRMLENAERLEFSYPEAGGETRTAIFEVSGVDLTALPGWE